MLPPPPRSTLFPYTTLFRSAREEHVRVARRLASDYPDVGAIVLECTNMPPYAARSEEHTSELQSPYDLVCRLLLEKKKKKIESESLAVCRTMVIESNVFGVF